MPDPSDRFAQTLPCGCSLEQDSWSFCVRHYHQELRHSAHRVPVPDCLDCEDLLAEARGLMDEGWAE